MAFTLHTNRGEQGLTGFVAQKRSADFTLYSPASRAEPLPRWRGLGGGLYDTPPPPILLIFQLQQLCPDSYSGAT